MVDAKSRGITITRLDSLAGDRECEVVFKNVVVPNDNLIGSLQGGAALAERIMMQGAVAECALMTGGAQWVMEMSVEYAKKRIAFDKPIGSYQAIAHKCSDMLVGVEGAKFITYEAAWALDQDQPCVVEVSSAKAYISDMYEQLITDAHQVHGGIGRTWEHDLTIYSRRAFTQRARYGDANFHRERVSSRVMKKG